MRERGRTVVCSLHGQASVLQVSGVKRNGADGELGYSSGSPKRICALSSSSVPAPPEFRIATGSGLADSSQDVIYVRTERVLLSQTFLTSWLVRRV